MIKFENTEVLGFEHAIRGMRNPMNSWDKSDSYDAVDCGKCGLIEEKGICNKEDRLGRCDNFRCYAVGENDMDLMKRLRKAGTDHRKYLRMITVYVDITAPMYWWSEFDTYKVGTVSNSTSKMHKLLSKPFEMNDFSFDKLPGYKNEVKQFRPIIEEDMVAKEYGVSHTCINDIINDKYKYANTVNLFEEVARPLVDTLNELRDDWFREEDIEKKKIIWYSILQLLPNSYNQKRTVMLNYETLNNIYKSRKNHKLDEWSIGFMKWIESLPYSEELICGKE